MILYCIFLPVIGFGQLDAPVFQPLRALPAKTEVAIGIYDRGTIRRQGWLVLKDTLIAVQNADKLFEIGSITKLFTVLTALEVLAEQGISQQESISAYLPAAYTQATDSITFAHLMTHTAGFPKMPNNFIWSTIRCPGDPFLHYSEKRMLRYLAKYQKEAGTHFQYSNYGVGLLAYLMTELVDENLEALMAAQIFRPLNMQATTLGIDEAQYKQVATPKKKNGTPKRTWRFSEVTAGAGQLYSTANDLTLFIREVLEKNTLDAALTLMEHPQFEIDTTNSVGLGWRILSGNPLIHFHGGITYGFKSLLAVDLKNKRGIVILTNAKGLSRKENDILRKVCFGFLKH